ncbi:hypothetical protein M1L60_02130 [Actinoplanes sp. TRM 88003]|uniref:Uncharacterized protein n=2 Tax=Paractinoplanes aksuensis TaxID=2939490 RepID=A0ABT1DF08_9ACTN|nr:hypothetical protein [Actinoplanes aksuensis]
MIGVEGDRAGSGNRAVRRRGRWTANSLVVVINGMLAGIGGVFMVTTSVPVTVVAATAAVLLGGVIVSTHR